MCRYVRRSNVTFGPSRNPSSSRTINKGEEVGMRCIGYWSAQVVDRSGVVLGD